MFIGKKKVKENMIGEELICAEKHQGKLFLPRSGTSVTKSHVHNAGTSVTKAYIQHPWTRHAQT